MDGGADLAALSRLFQRMPPGAQVPRVLGFGGVLHPPFVTCGYYPFVYLWCDWDNFRLCRATGIRSARASIEAGAIGLDRDHVSYPYSRESAYRSDGTGDADHD